MEHFVGRFIIQTFSRWSTVEFMYGVEDLLVGYTR